MTDCDLTDEQLQTLKRVRQGMEVIYWILAGEVEDAAAQGTKIEMTVDQVNSLLDLLQILIWPELARGADNVIPLKFDA